MNLIQEAELRVFGSGLVVEACKVLAKPHVVAVTGQLLFQQYMTLSNNLLEQGCVVVPAMAAFSLACHVEECGATPREVCFTFHAMLRRRKNLPHKEFDVGSSSYRAFKTALILEEKYILRVVGFDIYAFLDAHNPHRYALYVIKVLNGSPELAQATWNFLNDCARLDVALRHRPRAVVAAAVYLAGRKLDVSLPQSPHPWWSVLLESEEELLDVANDIMAIYRVKRNSWMEPPPPPTVDNDDSSSSTNADADVTAPNGAFNDHRAFAVSWIC